MSDSYDNNFGLTDSDCKVDEDGIYKPKSYIETRFALACTKYKKSFCYHHSQQV